MFLDLIVLPAGLLLLVPIELNLVVLELLLELMDDSRVAVAALIAAVINVGVNVELELLNSFLTLLQLFV